MSESRARGLTEELRLVKVAVPEVVSASDQVRSKGHSLVTGKVAMEVLLWPATASSGMFVVAKLSVWKHSLK